MDWVALYFPSIEASPGLRLINSHLETKFAAMNGVPEFKGNVRAFRTDVLVDKAAEEIYPT